MTTALEYPTLRIKNTNSSQLGYDVKIWEKVGSHRSATASAQIQNPNFFDQIEQLKKELFDGWDGEDGLAPTLKATIRAKGIIRYASYLNRNIFPSTAWHNPELSPTSDGGFDFEWEIEGRYLLLNVSGEGEISCLIKKNQAILGSGLASFLFACYYIQWVLGGVL